MKPSSRYVVEGFFCIIWSSLDPCIIDLSRFYKKSQKLWKLYFLLFFLFKTQKNKRILQKPSWPFSNPMPPLRLFPGRSRAALNFLGKRNTWRSSSTNLRIPWNSFEHLRTDIFFNLQFQAILSIWCFLISCVAQGVTRNLKAEFIKIK